MKIESLTIPGAFQIANFLARDNRGVFVKTFHDEIFEAAGIHFRCRESFYSQSAKNVLRGMHFQLPPFDHDKLVYVVDGSILDVIVDLRKSSPTYGCSVGIELNAFGSSFFVPKGCAHGFLTLSDSATVVYNVSSVHNKEADTGIVWNSVNYNWPVSDPILSERDRSFTNLKDFNSPF